MAGAAFSRAISRLSFLPSPRKRSNAPDSNRLNRGRSQMCFLSPDAFFPPLSLPRENVPRNLRNRGSCPGAPRAAARLYQLGPSGNGIRRTGMPQVPNRLSDAAKTGRRQRAFAARNDFREWCLSGDVNRRRSTGRPIFTRRDFPLPTDSKHKQLVWIRCVLCIKCRINAFLASKPPESFSAIN